MWRYEGCRVWWPHKITGDGYARLMGLNETRHGWLRIWQPEDDEFIRANYPGHSQEYLEKHLACGGEALVKRLIFLGLRESRERVIHWRECHTKKLLSLFGKVPMKQVVQELGFNEGYIRKCAYRMGFNSLGDKESA